MEGNPTPADLAQFREVIAMLEDKKTKLLTQIDEIQQDISAISAKTKTEKQKSLQVDRQLAGAEAEAKKRPSKEERKQAEHLQHQIKPRVVVLRQRGPGNMQHRMMVLSGLLPRIPIGKAHGIQVLSG